MNGKPLPFQAPPGTPLIGQPFTITGVFIPLNMQVTCNCNQDGVGTPLTIAMSTPTQCPNCLKIYNAAFNPTNGQIQMQINQPEKVVPS